MEMPKELSQWVSDHVICHYQDEHGEDVILSCTKKPSNNELIKLLNITLRLLGIEWTEEAMQDGRGNDGKDSL